MSYVARCSALLAPLALLLPPLLLALLTTVGPLRLDPVAMWGGVGIGHRPGWLPGFPSIDPNMGTTSFALGYRAATDLFSGHLPLWNHYEGLGAPLLGEMQSAALFPPTWLLLLPGGQAMEHALLQAVAGLGTFLFLRRFGLGTTAALAGGLLFEVNGVFAWLRNAVFNPVAFLPWLFWSIESLFHRERTGQGTRARPVGAGAIAAALSLYAGFPEVVYFNTLLLVAWATLRALSLPRRRALAFAAALLALATLALLLAAPLLIAFARFLREAAVGGHHGTEFRNHVLPPQAFLVALLPYVFGPIAAAPQPGVAAVWSDIGGYIGVAPLLLAVAGLVCTWRRNTTRLLAAWIILAVGASHGVPLLHGALTALPLVEIAAFCRYLDAAWIFAGTVLAATFIDWLATAPPTARHRPIAGAAITTAALLALGTATAWPTLTILLRAAPVQANAVLISATAGAGAVLLALLLSRLRRPAIPLAALAIAEATACFMLPYASAPHFAGVDHMLIDFLRTHAGLQRFALAGGGLGPNFGSVFGIPSMNYDDLPVPARTARFVTTRLDATNDGVIFGGNAPPADEPDRQARRARFLAALDGYRAAGVRYILSPDDFVPDPAYPLPPGENRPIPLTNADTLTLDLDDPGPTRTVAGLSILVGTYRGTTDGTLHAQLCQATGCTTGTAPLATAPDNRFLLVPFDDPATLHPNTPLRLTLTKQGGTHPLALWMRPAPTTNTHLSGLAVPPDHRPALDWIPATDPRPILRTPTATVLELMNPRPYATAPTCHLDIATPDQMRAHCSTPSRLLRLEVLADGWSARVNGTATPILPAEDTLQSIDLPPGDSEIEFTYAPTGVRPSIPLALATLALCLVLIARPGGTRPAGPPPPPDQRRQTR